MTSIFALHFIVTGISCETPHQYNHIHWHSPLSLFFLSYDSTRMRQNRKNPYPSFCRTASIVIYPRLISGAAEKFINSARLSLHMCFPFQGTPGPFTPLQAVSAISCMVFRFLILPDRHHRECHYKSAAFCKSHNADLCFYFLFRLSGTGYSSSGEPASSFSCI